MDIKDSYLHGTVGVVKSISVTADKLTYNLADVGNTAKTVTLPLATTTANGLLSSTDKTKLDNLSTTLGNYVTVGTDQQVTGVKTFTKQLKFTVAQGTAPFTVTSTTKVANLNVDYLDGISSAGFIRYISGIDSSTTTSATQHIGYGYNNQGWNTSGPAISIGAANGYIMQMQQSAGGSTVYVRYGKPDGFGDWKLLAFTDSNITGNAASADKVANNLILKINSGATEGTSLYTYNGSSAKTLDIKNGTGIGFTNTAGVLSIYNSGVRSISTGTTNGTISVNTNGTSANVAVKGLGSAAYTNTSLYQKQSTYVNNTGEVDVYKKITITKSDLDGYGVWLHSRKQHYLLNSGAAAMSTPMNTFWELGTAYNASSEMRIISVKMIAPASSSNITLYVLVRAYTYIQVVTSGTVTISDSTSAEYESITSSTTGWVACSTAKWTDTTYSVVSNSANGLAPKVINTNTATVGSAYYVLASTNGSATPSWYKLPSNAFVNDDTKVTQTNTTTSASYRVLLSGNANDTTETTTARKSTNLTFNPNTGILSSVSIAAAYRSASIDSEIKSGTMRLYHVTKSGIGNLPSNDNANSILWIGNHSNDDGTTNVGYGYLLGFTHKGIFAKLARSGTFQENWNQIAYTTSDITGNAASADKLKTKRKLWGLDFDGSADVSGNMTGVGVINGVFKVTSIQNIAQLNVSEGSSDINYSHLYISSNNTSYPNTRPLVLQYGYGNVGIGIIAPSEKLEVVGNVKATSFVGNLDGTYVNKLTGYSKATSASNIAATDTLKSALGKLEYKAHYAYDWVIGVTATDTDEYINKWGEIVGFLDSVKEGTDILDEFVTRKTAQTITGTKTFSKVINSANSGGSWVSGMTNASIKYDSLNALNASNYHPIIGVKTNGENVVNLGAYVNDVGFYGYKKGRTDNSYDWLFKFNSETGAITHTGPSITANKFITSGGTSSKFVKGDGSLDSTTYAAASALSNYLPLTGGTLSGNLYFSGNNNIIWNSGSYWQRLFVTDDAIAGTEVFTFQQSTDKGTTWANLCHIKDDGGVVANSFIKSGGTSSQFLKADGSVDSNKYLINTNTTHTSAYYRTTNVNGTNYAFWSHVNTAAFTIYAPTTAGTQGLVLTSNGSGAPVWSNASNLNAAGAKVLLNYYSSRPTSLNVSFSDGGVRTFKETSASTEGKCSNPGHILHFAWDNGTSYGYQLAMINADHTTHGIEFRGHNGNKWGDWYKVLTELNYTTWINTTNFPGLNKTGTVTSIKVGSTSYSPSSGVVSLPAYPTSLKSPNTIKFKNTAGTVVSYDGSAAVDLTGGVNNAKQLDGNAETSYLRYRGEIDTTYADLTDTTVHHANFKKPSPGMYTIRRTGSSEMFVSFAMNTGSCSSLEFKVNYPDTARLYIRKVIDSNRISGDWRALAWYSDIPTTLKNPYTLTFAAGTFAAKTYDGSAAVTVNVPTKTSHLTNDSGFLTSRGYIGTTQVQASSAELALTGISTATAKYYVATQAMALKSSGLSNDLTVANRGGLFSNGVLFNNPTTPNDVGFIRICGTGETDTVLEIGTGDDGASTNSEAIAARLYRAGAVVKEAWLLDIAGNTSFPGNVKAPQFTYNFVSASALPFIYVGSNNLDVTLLRVYSSDQTDSSYLGAYGYSLKYLGTGSGVGNYLNFYADNKAATAQTLALSMDNSGNVGIKTSANEAYALKVSGSANVTSVIYSDLTTSTYINGNNGLAIICSKASAGSYTMLAKMNSTNGYFTHGTYGSNYLLQYTAKTTVDAGTNSVTKQVILLDESGNSSFPGAITSTGFKKSGSSDSYVLLGGGGHKTISSLSVASANKLNSTTIVSAKAFSLINTTWLDTGYTFASLATGTYAVQITSGSNLVASGIMSVYTNLSDTAGDEIPLHVYGTAGWRPYLRTHANKLLISSNDASATSRTVTIKIAQIL